MVYEEKNGVKTQNILLENRHVLKVSGVLDVLNFDEQMVTVETDLRSSCGERGRFKNESI